MINVGNKFDKLREAFDQIAAELRSQYNIGFTPTNAKLDGTYRKLEIKNKQSYKIQARAGDYAWTLKRLRPQIRPSNSRLTRSSASAGIADSLTCWAHCFYSILLIKSAASNIRPLTLASNRVARSGSPS